MNTTLEQAILFVFTFFVGVSLFPLQALAGTPSYNVYVTCNNETMTIDSFYRESGKQGGGHYFFSNMRFSDAGPELQGIVTDEQANTIIENCDDFPKEKINKEIEKWKKNMMKDFCSNASSDFVVMEYSSEEMKKTKEEFTYVKQHGNWIVAHNRKCTIPDGVFQYILWIFGGLRNQ